MPGVASHRTVWTLTAALFWGLLSLPAAAQIRFDLPPQSLAQALTSVGNLANLNVYFDPRVVDGHQAPALKADVTVDEALSRLLAGTSLKAVRVDDNTVRVVADSPEKHAQNTHAADTGAVYTPNSSVRLASAGGAQDVDAQRDTRLAAADASATDDTSHSRDEHLLDMVLVTAQKREERLQDVPVPVTAISGADLMETNQLRIEDYYSTVPGLNVTPAASLSSQYLTIRGITTGVEATNPTVGVTVDDVPYGATTQIGGGGSVPVPDIDPGDLQRVEVLRGPQGTLYGASSMGGLLKFVTVDPSTDHFSGRVQAGADSVRNGADLGYNVRGSVNMPVGDAFAVRASAFVRRDPGYIDNVQTGQLDVNRANVDGGRLSALWKASDRFSLKLSALFQNTRGAGFADVDKPVNGYTGPPLGDLQQSYIRGTGGYERKAQAYSAIMTAKLGTAELTSITGYNVNQFSDSYDLTYVLGDSTLGQFGAPGTPATEHNRTNKITQEVRLADSIGTRFDWLVGAFYTHERSQYAQDLLAEDPASGNIVGQWAHYSAPATYEEYAAFADLTVHFTNRFDVQVGGREARINETFSGIQTGPYDDVFLGQPSPYIIPEERSRNNAFTYLLTPRFKLSSEVMLYARLASGYRPGGPNANAPGLPSKYNPDKTQNYEIGAKADFWDHRLTLDSSIYYIDWKDIQMFLLDPVTFQGYTANGSRAKSQGLELSAELRPVRGLKIGGWVAWDNAELTQALPANTTAAAGPGDRLPYSSRFSANASVEDDFPLTDRLIGFGGFTASYVGGRLGEFASIYAASPQRQEFPSYTRLDLRAGLRYDGTTLSLYVNNATDERGVLSGGLGTSPPFAFIYLQPRTIGVTVSQTF